MARITFLGQPRPGEEIGRMLAGALRSGHFSRFRAAVAWAKASGLRRIADDLTAFRGGGGRSRVIVGIDERGGTWEGLELAKSLFDDPLIFHDPGTRTFHPKVYLVESDTGEALAIVGSGNLTKGGLFTNYEAALALNLDVSDADDAAIVADLTGYLDWFEAQSPACQPLTDKLIDEMRLDPGIVIVSERETRERRASGRTRYGSGGSLFGDPLRGLANAPKPTDTAAADDDDDDSVAAPRRQPAAANSRRSSGRTPAGPGAPAPAPAAPRGFYKRLANNDVSLHSSPGQMIIPKEFLDFFPALNLEIDETAAGGPRQLSAEFPVEFQDGSFTKHVLARVIYYEPALHHPRQNIDVRFTFRDHEILERLSAGDYLVFLEGLAGVLIRRHPPGAFADGWGWL